MVGRGGWLRLPEELLERAGIGTRAAASLEDGRIVVSAAGGDGVRPEPELAPLEPVPAGEPVAELRGVVKTHGHGAAPPASSTASTPSSQARRLTAVTGPSGSGKTTLLHLLAGLDLPDEGEVLVGDAAVNALDRSAAPSCAAARSRSSPQQSGLVPFLSARENVELGLEIRGLEGDPHEVARRGRARRARRPAGLAAVGRRAGARRGRARARGAAGAAARRRADGPARPGERAPARDPARRRSRARPAPRSSARRTIRS